MIKIVWTFKYSNVFLFLILKFYFFPYGQRYKGILSKLLDENVSLHPTYQKKKNVSLHPLTTSIQELVSAAKEAEDEAKVISIHYFWHACISDDK